MKSNLARWLVGFASVAAAAGACAQQSGAPATAAAVPQTTPTSAAPATSTAAARPSSPAALGTSPTTGPLLAEEPVAGDRPEPNVQHSVIEDQGSKIDELRVRGQTRYIVVTPKVGTTKSYQILVNNDGRLPFEGTGGVAGATGKRVWNVFDF